MLVRNFEGMTMSDAMKEVKKAFGNNAVILSTNEKKVEGFEKNIVEIKAAAPETKSVGGDFHLTNRELDNIESQITILDDKFNKFSKNAVRENQIHTLETGLQEIKLLLLESLRNKDGNIDRNLPKDLIDLGQHLRVMGLEESHCTEMMNHLSSIPYMETDGSIVERSEFYKSHAIRWMHKKIKIAPQIKASKGSTSVNMVVGPSGAGKTSYIAKMAANFKNNNDANVLIVSFDNKRIAASDQLRIYSKILDIDFITIDSSKSLEQYLLKNRAYDLVFIDTDGRNPRSDQDMCDLRSFNDCAVPIETHLILSLTEKQSQMDRAIRNFSSIGLTSLVFSKLDESWTYGEIYNMAQKWSLPLSYFTTGQEIPGGFERASRERVLERIFCL